MTGAVKAVEDAVRSEHALTEVFIRNLHRVLLKEPYDADAMTPHGEITKRRIAIGEYKTVPNNVRTSTGRNVLFHASRAGETGDERSHGLVPEAGGGK